MAAVAVLLAVQRVRSARPAALLQISEGRSRIIVFGHDFRYLSQLSSTLLELGDFYLVVSDEHRVTNHVEYYHAKPCPEYDFQYSCEAT